MAIEYLTVDTSQRLGSELRQAVNYGNAFDTQVARLKEIMETMIDGTDYSAVEANFGLQAGSGETVYNLVTGAATDTGGTNIHQLLIRLG